MLTVWAAIEPVFVSWRFAVTVVPEWATFSAWALRLGGPLEPEALTVVDAPAEVFEDSMLPVRSVAML